MLRVIRCMADLPFGNLMNVYAQSNFERGFQWPDEPAERRIALAEQEFYAYLRQCFFTLPDSRYFLWEEQGRVVSAVRCEGFGNGVLLTALETDPAYRCKGYATALLKASLQYLKKGDVYVHIRRDNLASVSIHLRVGFTKVKTGARMLDGSYSGEYDTYLLKLS